MNKLNLKTGDKIDFMMKDGEVLLVPVSKQVSDVFGILSRDGQKAVTVEEMNEGIKERVKNLNS
ncbi:MAG TPA: AbrB family transcriptional regulator [Spirochaetota bacterium]|mgnify:FL=1|nr:AbrB family transcriptional regulator [Spirochaetota bacterium]